MDYIILALAVLAGIGLGLVYMVFGPNLLCSVQHVDAVLQEDSTICVLVHIHTTKESDSLAG